MSSPSPSSSTSPPRWPHGARAAVAFTMDNLGEAQDVRTGRWQAAAGRARKYGTHPAVWDVLPRILGLLESSSSSPPPTSSPSLLSSSSSSPPKQKQKKIRATYFAEAWSLPVYPHVLPLLLRNGDNNNGDDRDNGSQGHHELAWHGYQHEPWHTLSEADEAAVFARSFEVIASTTAATVAGGTTGGGDRPRPPNYYRGFRPPGGRLNGQRTLRLLRQYGVRYVSPLGRTLEILRPPPQDPPQEAQDSPQDQGEGERGSGGGQQENEKGIVVLPFEWEAVDAFWYMEKFAATRKEHGVQEAPLGPDAFRESLFAKLDAVKHEGGYMSFLFHPFLTTSEDRFQVLHDVLERLRGDPEIWVAPCHEVAEWVSEHADQFGL